MRWVGGEGGGGGGGEVDVVRAIDVSNKSSFIVAGWGSDHRMVQVSSLLGCCLLRI